MKMVTLIENGKGELVCAAITVNELMLIAVRPDMQGLGINALVFAHLIPVYNKMGIKWCETGPQLENNVKELSQWKPMNPSVVKRRRCWEKKI